MKICKKCPKTCIEFKNERSFYHHCQINELSRQFASINNTEKRDDILENFGHEMFSHAVPWIVWLSFHAQDLQKYHPLGSSTYCENTKISCIPQNFKYITTSDSFIRSQLILVAPCVIRQFCRYCPYSNKPVIWATVPKLHIVYILEKGC